MSTRKESFLEEVRTIQREMDLVLEGMDYCLDWKPSEGEWSAREVVYHLVDTPAGGIHTAVKGLLDGRMEEVPVTASLTDLAGERHATDLDAVRGDIARVTSGMEEALSSATDADLAGKRFLFHSITRSVKEERTVEQLIAGIFVRHWREHLDQLAALREALGLG